MSNVCYSPPGRLVDRSIQHTNTGGHAHPCCHNRPIFTTACDSFETFKSANPNAYMHKIMGFGLLWMKASAERLNSSEGIIGGVHNEPRCGTFRKQSSQSQACRGRGLCRVREGEAGRC